MRQKIYRTDISINRERRRAAAIIFGILFAIAAIVALILVFFLRAPIFKVKEVQILGNGYIPEESVVTFLRGKIGGGGFVRGALGYRNILNWPDGFSKEDLKLLPDAKSVTIQKSYLDHRVVVTVTPRVRRGIVCFRKEEPSRCFWFDGEGVVWGRAPATEGPLLLFLNDYSRPGPNTELMEPRLLVNLFSIFDALGRMPVIYKELRLEDMSLEEIRVTTFTGPDLKFSLRFSAKDTPAAYAAIKEKHAVSSLQYIDFRTENRVYYK